MLSKTFIKYTFEIRSKETNKYIGSGSMTKDIQTDEQAKAWLNNRSTSMPHQIVDHVECITTVVRKVSL
jgi:hypothetical protein